MVYAAVAERPQHVIGGSLRYLRSELDSRKSRTMLTLDLRSISMSINGAHWGIFRPRIEGNHVAAVEPFEHDPAPIDLIYGMPAAVHARNRVTCAGSARARVANTHISDTPLHRPGTVKSRESSPRFIS